MKDARDDIRGEMSTRRAGGSSGAPAVVASAASADASEALLEASQPLIELKPSLGEDGLCDERGPFEPAAITLMRVVSGAMRREAGLIDPMAVFGDEDEDYEDDFDDEDDEEEDDLDEDDEDEDDEFDDEEEDDDEEEEDEFDELDDEEDEEVFEADLEDDD